MPEADDFEWYYAYISSEVLIPQDGEHMHSDKFNICAKCDMGNVIGFKNSNPIIDMRV